MIYVLLLEENKVYVGFTARPLNDRVIEHFTSSGSKWTKKYKPLEVLEIHPGNLKEENIITLEMMKKYGWYNVRGGSWCMVEMNKCPAALLKYQNIELPDDFTFLKITEGNVYKKKAKDNMFCTRCGRNSHNINKCYANTTIEGYYIESYESDTEEDTDSSDYDTEDEW